MSRETILYLLRQHLSRIPDHPGDDATSQDYRDYDEALNIELEDLLATVRRIVEESEVDN